MVNYGNTEHTLEEFACAIELLADVLKDITRVEKGKAEAASRGRHEQIDTFLKREQVYILKLRGIEKKRLQLAEAMGWKGLTFRQILNEAEAPLQKRLSPLFTRLDYEIRNLQNTLEASEKIIKVRLREFEYIFSAETGRPEGIQTHFHERYV